MKNTEKYNISSSDNYRPIQIIPIVRFCIMGICEIRSVILFLAFCLIYLCFFLFILNGYSLSDSILKIVLWFTGSTSGIAELPKNTNGDIKYYLLATLIGYFFLGVIVFVITSAIKKAQEERKKTNPQIPSIIACLSVLFDTEKQKKSKDDKNLIVFLAILFSLPVIYCGLKWFSENINISSIEEQSKKTKTIIAVEMPISYSAVTHIAYSNGYIAAEGLSYNVISVPAGPDIINSLRGGGDKSADIGSIAVTPIITMIGAGDYPVILATVIKSNVQVQLVSFSSTGITQNPKTLKGKKIGYVASTNGEVYLSRLLKKADMSEKDIIAVNGRPADIKSLLLRGDIDAAILWDPFVAQLVRQGKEISTDKTQISRGEPVVYVDPDLYTLRFNITTTKMKLSQYRPEFIKFLRASVKASQYIKENPDKARHELEKWLNLYEGELGYFVDTTSFTVHLDVPQLKSDMQTELEWLKARLPTTIIPNDFSPYIDSSLLKEIDSTKVKE